MPHLPETADDHPGAEHPPAEPEGSRGQATPAPSDGSTSAGAPPDAMEATADEADAEKHPAAGLRPAGPPTDPETPVTS
ncbi:MAG: hypothetical protein M3Y91_00810 [Actinomycetota bacterium]|nr:hypothetical protein [Actinomycetota bacterium]